MAVLENGYNGNEKRKNTNKVRFEFKDYLKIVIIPFITLLFAIGIWYGVTNYRMNAFAENDKRMEVKIDLNDKEDNKRDVEIGKMQTQIENIDERTRRIDTDVQDIQKLTYKIAAKLGVKIE